MTNESLLKLLWCEIFHYKKYWVETNRRPSASGKHWFKSYKCTKCNQNRDDLLKPMEPREDQD